MANRVFVDTWGWLALRDRNESRHVDVSNFYRQVRLENRRIITTDYVLDETITLLFRRLSFSQAQNSVSLIDQATVQGYLTIEYITPDRFESAKQLRVKYDDKPLISFTDLTSMVVMSDLGIENIITADAHFSHVGMGFNLRP